MSKFLNISTDNTLGGSSASDDIVASQKAVKDYVDGALPTVDQTYDSTSTNAQSGTAVAQALAGFSGANTDLSNLTSTGKSTGAGLAMPSSTYDALTLGASGSSYAAPANGYISLLFYGSVANGSSVVMLNTSNYLCNQGRNGGYNNSCYSFIPLLKGQKAQIHYNGTPTSVDFRFIYAEGEN